MARIPTYTAEGGLPAGGTGPQASPAAYAAPARALGGLGESIAQTGSTIGRIGLDLFQQQKQRQDQDDAFWATKESENLHRELFDYLEKNQDSETLGDDFLNYSNQRISELAKTAPTGNAGKMLEARIGDNVTSLYKQASRASFVTKENNRIEESKNAAQQIGATIQSTTGYFQPLAVELSKKLIEQRMGAIDQLNYSEESKKKIKSAFLVETILASAPSVPEFAKTLVENPVFDEAQKIKLRNEIDSLQQTNNKLSILSFEQQQAERLKGILSTGVASKQPPLAQYNALYGKNGELERNRVAPEYQWRNTTVNEWNKIKSYSSKAQLEHINANKAGYSVDVKNALSQLAEDASKQQSGPMVVDWQMKNNKDISNAYDRANATADPILRAERLTAAHALSLQYQGQAPLVITDPEKRKMYLGRLENQTHLLSSQKAEEMASNINSLPSERLVNYINKELVLEFPDDEQRAIAWNDLVTIPKKGIKPEIQFVMMMPDPVDRANYLGIIKSVEMVNALSTEKEQDFKTKLLTNDAWEAFHKSIDPTFNPERPEIVPFRDAVITFAKRIAQKDKKNPGPAIEEAVNIMISKSWGFTKPINGQQLAIQRLRDDFGRKPIRTDAEVEDIGEKLKLAVSQIPIQEMKVVNDDGTPIFPKTTMLIENDMEKMRMMQMNIRSQSVWIMNRDGQGAQLWIQGDNRNLLPLRDKTGKPFEVDFDTVNKTPLEQFGIVRIGGIATLSSYQYGIEYPLITEKPSVAEYITSPFAPKTTKTNIPPVGVYWKNFSK